MAAGEAGDDRDTEILGELGEHLVEGVALVRMLDAAPPAMESSMQRDQAAGRPLELDAIGETVVRRAGRAGVPVPVTARLVEELRKRA